MKIITLPPTRDDWSKLYAQMMEQLLIIDTSSDALLDKALKACEVCKVHLQLLRKSVLSSPFKDDIDEAFFFRSIKPRFHCYFIYWNKVFNIEIRRPAVNLPGQRKYYQQESRSLRTFFTKHASFYQYYRSGASFLDQQYFLRNRRMLYPLSHPLEVDADASFSTIYDYLVARILANDMLLEYLAEVTARIKSPTATVAPNCESAETALTWQPTVVALAELVYALSAYGAISKSTTKLPDQALADLFSRLFNVNLDFFHKKKEEIRSRQKNRTVFLNALIRSLNQKMDEDDENAP